MSQSKNERQVITQSIYLNYLSALLEGDRCKCKSIVVNLSENSVEIGELYTKLFQKSLYRIGRLWETNRLSVAAEHMASSITESLMNMLHAQSFPQPNKKYSVIVACVPKEFHQIGARMVYDIFEQNGWQGYFCGANTPTKELIKLIEEKKPSVLALSSSFYMNMPKLFKMIEEIKTIFPEQKIITGGQAFKFGGKDLAEKYSEVKYIDSLLELDAYIKCFK